MECVVVLLSRYGFGIIEPFISLYMCYFVMSCFNRRV